MSLRSNLRLWLIILISWMSVPVSAQNDLPAMEALLRNAPPGQFEPVFGRLKAIIDKQPYKEAVVNVDALLHLAADLPNFQEAFGWMYELTKTAYNSTGHEDNLFLYLLSIADDPAFQKPPIRQKILYETGFSYYNIGDFEKAQVMLEKFIAAYTGPVNRDLINGLTTLGIIYENRRSFDQAGHYFRTALEKATATKDSAWIGLANGNLGGLYLQMNKLDESQALVYRDVNSSLQHELFESAANDYCDLATIALRKSRSGRAKSMLDSAALLLRSHSLRAPQSWASVYKNLGRYFFTVGHPDSAYHYLQTSQRILDSLQSDRNESMLKLRVSTFAQQKAEQDAALLKVSQEAGEANRRLAIISAFGVVLVVVFALLYIRQKKRINSVLRERANQVEAERRLEEELRKKEEAANHAKDKLFSLIAHDLRGPIGSLAMVLGAMEKGSIQPQSFMAVLPGIKSKVDNIYNVTDNLLRWAYAQMEGSHVQKETIPIAPIIDNVVTLLQDGAAKKNIALRHSVEPALTVTADPNQLEIVIRNLASNAIKFCPGGSVVHIAALGAGNETVIKVSDNGPGLPPEVFDNFLTGKFSAPSIGTAGEKGAGLGLVMCNEFVGANGGRLRAALSETGTGTVFTISLPAD